MLNPGTTHPRSFACPYCGTILAKRPTRKIACPACQEMIYVRDDLPVTKQQADDYDLMKSWTAIAPAMKPEDIERTRTDLSARWGKQASMRDAIWGTMNQTVVHEPDAFRRADMYDCMAMFLKQEGRDDSRLLEQAEKSREQGRQQMAANPTQTIVVDMPPVKPKKSRRRAVIVAIVALILICMCLAIASQPPATP